MAEISQIKLPNNSIYDLKVYSNHIAPMMTKTFTNVIGTANNWAGATFFFGSIKPTSWDTTWRIRYKINVYVPNHQNYRQIADVMITGTQGALKSFYSFNTIGQYYVCYYHELYRLKSAGFTNGYGHSLGVRFYSAYNPIDTNYKRTIEIEIYELTNCTFDFYDECLLYASIPGTGSTNYETYSEIDFVNNGMQETSDANDVNYNNREYYGSRTTKNALYRYQFCVTDSTGQIIPINSVSNSIATNKTLMTDSFDPFGEMFYWASTSTYSAGANVGNSNWYRQYLADLRYSFNIGGYDVASTLTARLPLYLVCSLQSDGTVKLNSSPLSQTLPISDDGLLYIYLGRIYEDTYPYRLVLTFNHPVYWYKNGAVRQYCGDAATVNGKTPLFTHQDISGKADKATTLAGYGITDAKIASGVITLGSNTITPLTSSSTLSAAKLSGAIPSAVTATTQASTDNSTKIATTAYVTTAIANLPEPMLFKGSVGIDGTVRTLPTAAASNEGWTYKVITALSSPAAEVGDTVISNGSEWVVIPSGDEPSGTVTSVGVSNGGGLSVSGSPITSSGTITVSHADTSSQASSSNSGRTYIQSITLDTYGHVTGLSTATETVTNTDTKLKVAEVTSATQYYPLVGTGTAAAERQYDTTGFKYAGTTGTTRAVGSATLELGNSIASGTTGNKQGQIIMYGANAKKATITLADPSADIALALPTSGGTLALASQIPSSTNSATTGITATTTATKTTLGTAFTIPNVTSAGSASSWTFEEKTIPNVTAAGSGSASLTFAMDTTDTKKLKITFSHTHTAPTIGTAIKVQSKKSGANGSAPTLGTAFTVPNVTGNTSATVTIVDGGHTHTI